MSGDKQTLRELRHQILARKTVRNPPSDVVPDLNVQALKEHAWLGSLVDVGVVADSSFYGRLARDFGPTHPPVVDLGSDNDSIANRDEVDTGPSTSGQEPTIPRIDIAISESSSMAPTSRPEPIPHWDDVLHYGVWLPLDYSSGPKNTTICRNWREYALHLNYCRAEDLYDFSTAYKLVIAIEGSKVTDCPTKHMAIYAHHLEFGLRFPLNLVLVKILKAFNVCLAQLTPLAVRNLIAYV